MSCEFEQEHFDLKDDPAAQKGEYELSSYLFLPCTKSSFIGFKQTFLILC